jgi:DNA ligase-1
MNAFEHLMKRAKQKPVFNGSPTLAHTYKNQDIKNWLISEKLDGVRAIWNGKYLVTRNNNIIKCPATWIRELPEDVSLDGELYIDRGCFNELVSIVRRELPTNKWNKVKYKVFDAPTFTGTFKERYDKLLEFKLPSFCEIVGQVFYEEANMDILQMLLHIEDKGGEGIMVRNPNIEGYIEGRTHELLKIKSFEDYDAIVIDILAGEGRHVGRMGALLCKIPGTEITFKVGTGFTDKQRDNPPIIGDVIKYKCMEFTEKGVPRFPVFIGKRVD